MPPRASRTTVRLTGIPLRHQGAHDSLCAYYAAAMLACTLRPELEDAFEAAQVAADPLFGNLPRRAGQRLEAVVADWIAAGVHLQKLCRALNRACAPAGGRLATRFSFRRMGVGAATVARLRAQVDAGLPTLLGWESRELGQHTVLVVGHERYHGSRSEWLRVIDPARVSDVLEWGQLAQRVGGRVDVIACERHDGVRPDRMTTVRAASGAVLAARTRIDRWEPATREWRRLV